MRVPSLLPPLPLPKLLLPLSLPPPPLPLLLLLAAVLLLQLLLPGSVTKPSTTAALRHLLAACKSIFKSCMSSASRVRVSCSLKAASTHSLLLAETLSLEASACTSSVTMGSTRDPLTMTARTTPSPPRPTSHARESGIIVVSGILLWPDELSLGAPEDEPNEKAEAALSKRLSSIGSSSKMPRQLPRRLLHANTSRSGWPASPSPSSPSSGVVDSPVAPSSRRRACGHTMTKRTRLPAIANGTPSVKAKTYRGCGSDGGGLGGAGGLGGGAGGLGGGLGGGSAQLAPYRLPGGGTGWPLKVFPPRLISVLVFM